MGNKARGFYHKFDVVRTDGTSEPGRKHHGCEYFVLDMTHDPFAKSAIEGRSQGWRLTPSEVAQALRSAAASGSYIAEPNLRPAN